MQEGRGVVEKQGGLFSSGNVSLPNPFGIEVVKEGCFVVPEGAQKAKDRYLIEYLTIMVAIILCFDGRPLWRKLWRLLCQAVPAENLKRVPLAGASGLPIVYADHLDSARGLDRSQVVVPVITHSPCGGWIRSPSRTIEEHGWRVCSELIYRGWNSFAVHFELLDQVGPLVPTIYDPRFVEERFEYAGKLITVARSLEGMKVEDGELEQMKSPKLYIVRSGAFGYPPELDDHTLVLSGRFPDQLLESLCTAQRLGGGTLGQTRIVDCFYNET